MLVVDGVSFGTSRRKFAHDFHLQTYKNENNRTFSLVLANIYQMNCFCIGLVVRTCLNLKNSYIFRDVSLLS